MAETVALEVTRYRPEHDSAPSTQTFEVPLRKDWTVLDALNHIKDKQDGSLTYRWSCRMGVCGSCGMMVNGSAKLTCAAFLTDCAAEATPIRVEPLAFFPVIRDLVIDLTDFLGKLRKVKPWVVREKDKPLSEGEYRQTPAQLDQYKQFSMCINCLLCYAACPVIGLEPGFLGPAVLALARRYNLDNRDQGSAQRLDLCTEHDGIWQCTFVGECSKVCPKNVDPAGAIQQYKLDAALASLRSLVLPWSSR